LHEFDRFKGDGGGVEAPDILIRCGQELAHKYGQYSHDHDK